MTSWLTLSSLCNELLFFLSSLMAFLRAYSDEERGEGKEWEGKEGRKEDRKKREVRRHK